MPKIIKMEVYVITAIVALARAVENTVRTHIDADGNEACGKPGQTLYNVLLSVTGIGKAVSSAEE